MRAKIVYFVAGAVLVAVVAYFGPGGDLRDLRERAEQYRAELDQAESRAGRLEAELERAERDIGILTAALGESKSELERIRAAHRGAIAELRASIADLSDLDTAVETSLERVGRIEGATGSIETVVRSVRERGRVSTP